jgi:lipopolysaccharide biosynthesis glycosyltransferase
MSLRSESKKFLYADKVERELEMKEADSIPAPRRPLPRFQKDSTNCVSAGRERASPGHRAWPLLPFFGVVLCMGILGIHLLPPSKYMNFADPFSSYDPDQKWVFPNVMASINNWKRSQLDDNRSQFEQGGPQEYIHEPLPNTVDGSSVTAVDSEKKKDIHVFVCTDESDLRPLAVLINSSMHNTPHPERLFYHLVMPTSQKFAAKRLKHLFPKARIEMANRYIDIHEVEGHIMFRNDTGARKELVSPYNFLPFYLPRTYSDIRRIIYLDSDIVVKGNLEDLNDVDLEGHSVAAIEDCSQRFQVYFDFAQLDEIQKRRGPDRPPWLPDEPFNKSACVFNRGVLVIDNKRWQEENITKAIVWWMDEFRKANKKALYKAGMSQPPFLLALYGKHKVLDETWNVRGLGRPNLSDMERAYYQNGWNMTFNRIPFMSPFADEAHILHFNGKYKPWKGKRHRGPNDEVVSICGDPSKSQECSSLWWEYLSPQANDFLKKRRGTH